jgi:hypothetical protein
MNTKELSPLRQGENEHILIERSPLGLEKN